MRPSLLLLCLCIFACAKKHKFKNDDLLWQPYKGGEVLIFQSEKGELDTIFIHETIKSSIVPYGPGWGLLPEKFETLCIRARHSDPSPPRGSDHRYLNGCILRLNSVKEPDQLWIQFSIAAKNAWFYHSNRMKSDLNKLPKVRLQTPYKTFKDIIIIESNDDEYKERSNYIERIYWSMAEGYVRYDLKNGRYWHMIDKQ